MDQLQILLIQLLVLFSFFSFYIGAGILTLPYAIAKVGYGLGWLTMILFAGIDY